MSLRKKIYRMQFVDNLITRKATGSTNVLAKKLDLSRSHTLDFIREMKEVGFPIRFCKNKKSYHY